MSMRQRSVPFFADKRPEDVITDGSRLDGRGHEEFRSAFFDCGTVTQASGSAYVEFGSTKLVVAVYGPRQPDRGNTYSEEGFLECDVRLATFATRQRGRPGQSAQEREWTSQLETALAAAIRFETFPKAVLDVQCLVMESGGAVLPAAVCGACLALAEAGIEMLDLVSSVSVIRVQGLLLLDPTEHEEHRAEAELVVSYMASLNQVTGMTSRGKWTSAAFQDALELGVGACEQVDGALRQTLESKIPALERRFKSLAA